MSRPATKKTSLELEKLFQALGDRTRLRLLNLMAAGETCVCFFVAVIDAPQPTISRHLAYLRRSGLVSARRDGKWMHYGITPPDHPTVRRIFEQVIEVLADDAEMQKDRAALMSACCSTRVPEQLRRAPKPAIAAEM